MGVISNLLKGGSSYDAYGTDPNEEELRRAKIAGWNAVGEQFLKAAFARDYNDFAQYLGTAFNQFEPARRKSLEFDEEKRYEREKKELDIERDQTALKGNQLDNQEKEERKRQNDTFQAAQNLIGGSLSSTIPQMKQYVNNSTIPDNEKVRISNRLDYLSALLQKSVAVNKDGELIFNGEITKRVEDELDKMSTVVGNVDLKVMFEKLQENNIVVNSGFAKTDDKGKLLTDANGFRIADFEEFDKHSSTVRKLGIQSQEADIKYRNKLVEAAGSNSPQTSTAARIAENIRNGYFLTTSVISDNTKIGRIVNEGSFDGLSKEEKEAFATVGVGNVTDLMQFIQTMKENGPESHISNLIQKQVGSINEGISQLPGTGGKPVSTPPSRPEQISDQNPIQIRVKDNQGQIKSGILTEEMVLSLVAELDGDKEEALKHLVIATQLNKETLKKKFPNIF